MRFFLQTASQLPAMKLGRESQVQEVSRYRINQMDLSTVLFLIGISVPRAEIHDATYPLFTCAEFHVGFDVVLKPDVFVSWF